MACAQQVYKWTDENGKVHYSDQNTAPALSRQLEIKDSGSKQQLRTATSAGTRADAPAIEGNPEKSQIPAMPKAPERRSLKDKPIPPIPNLIKPGMSKDPQREKEAQCIALGLEILAPGDKYKADVARFEKMAELCPKQGLDCHFFESDVNKNYCVMIPSGSGKQAVSRTNHR